MRWESVLVIIEQIDKDLARELALIVGEEQAESLKQGGNNNPEGRNQHSEEAFDPETGEVLVNHDDIMIDQNVKKAAQGTDSAYLLRRLTRLATSNGVYKPDFERAPGVRSRHRTCAGGDARPG